MKDVYIVRNDRINGDNFDIAMYFNEADALKSARVEWNHMTESEQRKNIVSVNGYKVPKSVNTLDDFQNALEIDPIDPFFYVEVNE